jgi:hypothetical protein
MQFITTFPLRGNSTDFREFGYTGSGDDISGCWIAVTICVSGARHNTVDNFNLSGVYQLQCRECPCRYIGQTGWTFKTRVKEHIRDIKNNGQYPKCAQHVIDTGHKYDTMENTMKILHTQKKDQMLNA